ncbi:MULTISPECIES: large-conductance mechanosensitive channel protein MscL [Sphingobacterium]|jgi:large conductance mechanosensitive channel|uniref:Large-conductance mechanosensitive channel n=2 Tax=Sphingobacterium TaxID=28453 RepID=A0ABW5Z5A2_9SPHI|nr:MULTISPECIES: large-conductance mechanosensitive channel protein MscL [Sphingobacterium]KKX49068.1 large conductance mechanosensitive channel protein MscL [Sphingobacterium sp. IITKGP-BTPF85]MBB2952607.1 large conductance mechanosensitive channel [Sphingobacterium sp. JUb56]MCS3555997.1 large conductance mechanosensitive channel [Sphingobacterium sp. JUb21]MCW2261076.1 large conductance mechanosensitive channel [Sphingobacterium kitahiroshimense]NJI76283.1 large-conductance mechanosensitive
MGILKEFKEFAMRGSVVDLAVGVIIGGAFGKIVTSLVDDIIMPPIGYLTGGVDFSEIKYVLKAADEVAKKPEVAINLGNFINVVIQFLIVAFCIFMVIKALNSMKRKEDKAPEVAPAPTKEETLLTEIRDLLKNK